MKILFEILGAAALFLLLGTIGGIEFGTMPLGKGAVIALLLIVVMWGCALLAEVTGGRN